MANASVSGLTHAALIEHLGLDAFLLQQQPQTLYSGFYACRKNIEGIEAIDFFFAQQLVELVDRLADEDKVVFFHLCLALSFYQRQGHVCLPLGEISESLFGSNLDWKLKQLEAQQIATESLSVEDKSAMQAQLCAGYLFPSLIQLEQVLDKALDLNPSLPIKFEPPYLYIRRYWLYEQQVADNLNQRLAYTPPSTDVVAKLKTSWPQLFSFAYQDKTKIDESETDWQQVAVANSIGRKLSVICGGPGTGKTYTVARLLTALQIAADSPLSIMMAAPTGKAAQRLKESILGAKQDLLVQGFSSELVDSLPDKASTLHRLLGFKPNSTQFKHNRDNPLQVDVLLIDEVSMIDLPMMAKLLDALPQTSILILLGDAQQLPSVETGCVLSDLTRQALSDGVSYPETSVASIKQISGQVVELMSEQANNQNSGYVSFLTKTHRFGGDIGLIATEVIRSDINSSQLRLVKHQCFDVKENLFSQDPNNQISYFGADLVGDWLVVAAKHYYGRVFAAENIAEAFAALSQFRVLLPMRVGETGVVEVNKKIEQALASVHSHISYKPNTELVYQGKPIMVVENSYATGLFNGDIGLIWPDASGKLMAWFENDVIAGTQKYKCYSLARLPKVETVYAMTIHKTQGSEFSNVAIILPSQNSNILSPELIYTGITRAKKHLYLLGNLNIWQSALLNKTSRHSGLAAKLK